MKESPIATQKLSTSHPTSPGQRIGDLLARWLVEPFQPLSEIDRRNARLLVLFTLPILLLTVAPFALSGWEFRFAPTIILLALAYGLGRTRYYRAGFIIFAVGLVLPSYLHVAVQEDVQSSEALSAAFMWLVPVLIVGAAIASMLDVASLIILLFAGQIVAMMVFRDFPLRTASGPLGFMLANAILILIFMRHRNQLEKIRLDELRLTTEALMNAQESDKIKSQFLASMSHELRTPLNAIINFSQIMSTGALGELSDRQKDSLIEIVGSGKHLLALINDVLDMSKIQSGMLSLFLEKDVDLNPVISTVVGTTQSLLGDKPVQLIVHADETLPPVLGDRRRIQQILLNLLSNAAKFTSSGSIVLNAKQEGDRIVFGVTDTGPGIAASDREIIFRPFEQSGAGIRHATGTGLGLSISRSLVEAHGGTMWVDSVEGKGATFWFTLPVESESLKAQMAQN